MLLAAAMAAALVGGLTACADPMTADATAFIQGELDAAYLGQANEDYLKVVDGLTEEDVQETHRSNLELEGDYMLSYLGVEMPTDAVRQRAQEVVAEIYSHAKYTVNPAERLSSGDIAAEVTVSPIEITHLISQDFASEAWMQVLDSGGVTSDAQLAALSDEEYQALDEQYAKALLDELEAQIANLSYGQDQTVLLQMKEEDGYYSLVSTGMQKVDEIMIDYMNAYMQ